MLKKTGTWQLFREPAKEEGRHLGHTAATFFKERRTCSRVRVLRSGVRMTKPRLLVLLSLVVAAAAARLLPHPPNMTPITAIALFGGAYISDRRLAFAVPLAALFLSDAVLGFYNHMEVVYLSFALIVGIGLLIRSHRLPVPILAATLAAAVLFFVITNFGVWAFGGLYPKTMAGLAACYVAAIPFFGNMLIGDLFYAALLFGGFRLLESAVPSLREMPGEASAAMA